MSNRHLSRTIAMQTLYEWQFNHHSQKMQALIDKNLKNNFITDDDGINFVQEIVRGVTKNLESLDKTIEKYAPEWPIDKITGVDLAILRIGVYEIMFAKQNPPKVVINESIEMAKTFCGESAGKFVNGVLGSIYNKTQEAVNNKQEVKNE